MSTGQQAFESIRDLLHLSSCSVFGWLGLWSDEILIFGLVFDFAEAQAGSFGRGGNSSAHRITARAYLLTDSQRFSITYGFQ